MLNNYIINVGWWLNIVDQYTNVCLVKDISLTLLKHIFAIEKGHIKLLINLFI